MNSRKMRSWAPAIVGLCAALGAAASGCSPGEEDPSPTTTEGSTAETTDTTTATGGGSSTGEVSSDFCSPAATCPPDVTGVDLTTPVSFKTEVYPILFQKCSGNGGCHLKSSGGNVPTQLAFANAPASITELKTELTDEQLAIEVAAWIAQPSHIAPGSKNVVPGNWQSSFMMMKIDGCQNAMGVSCSVPPYYVAQLIMVCYDTFAGEEVDPTDCGGAMPLQDEPSATSPKEYPLDLLDKNKIRAWIQQGALLN